MNRNMKRDINEEIRKNARLPDGVEDLRGMSFFNIHNGVVMLIEQSWVGDTGVVLWTSDAGDVYSTLDIEKHWSRKHYWHGSKKVNGDEEVIE